MSQPEEPASAALFLAPEWPSDYTGPVFPDRELRRLLMS
jgi:hypothetical protein